MQISRKQALVALVVGVVPWIGRRAHAADVKPLPGPLPIQPKNPPQTEIDALKRRVETLEKQLAGQLAFTKDSSGGYSLKAPGPLTLSANGTLNIAGKIINLN